MSEIYYTKSASANIFNTDNKTSAYGTESWGLEFVLKCIKWPLMAVKVILSWIWLKMTRMSRFWSLLSARWVTHACRRPASEMHVSPTGLRSKSTSIMAVIIWIGVKMSSFPRAGDICKGRKSLSSVCHRVKFICFAAMTSEEGYLILLFLSSSCAHDPIG